MTDKELKIYVTQPPHLCPDCTFDIAHLVAENTELDQLYHHCPHTDTLAIA